MQTLIIIILATIGIGSALFGMAYGFIAICEAIRNRDEYTAQPAAVVLLACLTLTWTTLILAHAITYKVQPPNQSPSTENYQKNQPG